MTKWTILIRGQTMTRGTQADARAAVKDLLDAGIWFFDLNVDEGP